MFYNLCMCLSTHCRNLLHGFNHRFQHLFVRMADDRLRVSVLAVGGSGSILRMQRTAARLQQVYSHGVLEALDDRLLRHRSTSEDDKILTAVWHQTISARHDPAAAAQTAKCTMAAFKSSQASLARYALAKCFDLQPESMTELGEKEPRSSPLNQLLL